MDREHEMARDFQPDNAQAITDSQRPVWDRGADSYLDSFASLVPQGVAPILDAAAVESGTRVLDVATGPGLIAGAALVRGAEPTGIDFSERMIADAKVRHPGVEFRVADAASLPFEDGMFDAVTIGFGLFLVADPVQALREARRVLARGGRIAFTVWDDPLPAFDLFYSAMAKYVPSDSPAENPPLFGVTDHGVLTGLLTEVGFEDARCEPLPIIWELPNSQALYEALSTLRDFTTLPADVEKSFRADVIEGAAQYERGGRFLVPNPALLMSGLRR